MVPKGPVEVFGVDIYCLQPALPSSSDPDVAKEGIFPWCTFLLGQKFRTGKSQEPLHLRSPSPSCSPWVS